MDSSVQVSDPSGPGDDTMALPVVDQPAAQSGPVRRAPIDLWVIAGIVVLVLIQQTMLVLGWFSRFVSDDWALLWAAAESWGRLQPEQPNFWGQAYGSTLESIPTQLLHAVGIGYPLALPIVLTAAHLASWWIPAAAAWRRGRRFLAALAVAMPALLSTEYVVAASVYGTAAGRFVGGVVLAVVIGYPDRIRWVAAAVALSACAFLIDTSSLLMTAPACVYALVRCVPAARERGWRRTAITFLVGLTPVGAWLAFVGWWYAEHPTDNMHPTAPFQPSWNVLQDNLTNPERMLGPYTPEILRNPILTFAIIAGLGALVIIQRRIAAILALGTLMVVLTLVLSLGKTYDDLGTVYFQAARLLLPMPIGLWFVATCLRPLPIPEKWQRWTAVGLVVLIGLTATWRVVTWSDRGGMLEAHGVSPNSQYQQMPADELVPLCDLVREAAASAGTDIAIFDNRIAAYGCAAQVGPSLITVYPEYDRRRWVLEALNRPQDVPVVLYVGTPPGLCEAGETCTPVSPGIAAIDLGGRSPIQLLHDLQLTVRPF